jgi:hypothetical protein
MLLHVRRYPPFDAFDPKCRVAGTGCTRDIMERTSHHIEELALLVAIVTLTMVSTIVGSL